MGQLNSALRNVPRGLKIVSNRMNAAGYGGYQIPGVDAVGAQGNGDITKAGDTYQIEITGPVFGVDDLDRKIEDAIGKANRKKRLATYGVG